uniref:Uncharacterized protein n=1 Tax=Rhizophora mucronata TaxID=61149 RepID=A0A2P2MHK7_RHIMU
MCFSQTNASIRRQKHLNGIIDRTRHLLGSSPRNNQPPSPPSHPNHFHSHITRKSKYQKHNQKYKETELKKPKREPNK